jgi:carbonic anhydrase
MAAHGCRACIIFCMDFRLNGALTAFLSEQKLDKDGADIIRVAGAAKSLARPGDPRDRDFLMDQLVTSARLHGTRQFYLINHEDCGAYGQEQVVDSDAELAMHSRDLRTSRALLQERFPTSEVFTYFMRLDGRAEPIF